MQGLPFDGWLLIARYFTVQDLCRCMRVSHDWFYAWASDRMWMYQRARVCAVCPELIPVFDLYHGKEAAGAHLAYASVKSNTNKKRKTPWIMPRKGTWYVFKRILAQGFYMETIKTDLGRNVKWHPVICAIARMCTPRPDLIISTEILMKQDPRLFMTGTLLMYRIVMTTSTQRNIEVDIQKLWHHFKHWHLQNMDTEQYLYCPYSYNHFRNDPLAIAPWKAFILERFYGMDEFSEYFRNFLMN